MEGIQWGREAMSKKRRTVELAFRQVRDVSSAVLVGTALFGTRSL